MYEDEQHPWEYEEEPEPGKARGWFFRFMLVVVAVIVICMIIYGISPSTCNGAIQGGINWYNENYKYDYTFSQCASGEWDYIQITEYTYLTGGDGDRIEIFNCNHSKDPTWAELEAFLWYDQTDDIFYVDRGYSNSFVCSDYAETLHNEAEAAGIRAGYVTVELDSGISHALNAFNTVDKGLVFIDDTGTDDASSPYPCPLDRRLYLQIGEEYSPQALFSCFGWSLSADIVGTVTDVRIFW